MLSNIHSHTFFCDGTDAPEVYVLKAIELGLISYGFSSHAPVPFDVKWCMDIQRRFDYTDEIRKLKEKYASQLDILLGMEVDYIPGKAGINQNYIQDLKLDFSVGSVHLVDFEDEQTPWEIDGPHQVFARGLNSVFGGNVKKAVERYFELTKQMLSEATPTVLGHVDKIKMHNTVVPYFSEEEHWYKEQITDLIKFIKQSGVVVEINTRGMYKGKTSEPYPSYWIIKSLNKASVPLMLNSDCHHPSELVSKFSEVKTKLKQIGVGEMQALTSKGWLSYLL